MKSQILFPGKNKKNISLCRLLKILPRVLSVKVPVTVTADDMVYSKIFFHFSKKIQGLIFHGKLSAN